MKDEYDSEAVRNLIEQVKVGQRAFAELVTVSTPRVRTVVSQIVPERWVKDVVQMVFLKVWDKFDTFRQDALLSTWITRIAENTSINFVNSSQYRHETNTEPLPPEDDLPGTPRGDFDPKIWTCIARLVPKYSVPLLLRELAQLGTTEIALTYKTNENTVNTWLYRARERVRRCLEDKEQ